MTQAPDTEAAEYLTPAQVAALFGVKAVTVSKWARNGRLASIRTAGQHRRFLRTDVEAFQAALERQAS